MKSGDRVIVIAVDEYQGFSGEVVAVTPEGKLLVDVEITHKYRIPFDPHAVELEKRVRRSS